MNPGTTSGRRRAAWPWVAPLLGLLALVLVVGRGQQVAPAQAGGRASFSYVRAAQPLPQARPGEAVVLRLGSGTRPLTLTRRQLEALPVVEYRTRHPQLGRSFTYRGVPLRDLAALGGFEGRALWVVASDGFLKTIPAANYMADPVMLAYLADGQPIRRMQKGPLAVVQPPTRVGRGRAPDSWVWHVESLQPVP